MIVGNLDMGLKLGEYSLHTTADIIEVEIEPMENLGKTLIRFSWGDNYVQSFIPGIMRPPKKYATPESPKVDGLGFTATKDEGGSR